MSHFCSGITIGNSLNRDVELYRKKSSDVCDATYDRDISSGPTRRTAYIVRAKNKSDKSGTKDQHVATRLRRAAQSHDLQALRADSSAGFEKRVRSFTQRRKTQRKPQS